MSAETLISGGVRVMDGHCWGPSPMLIQDLASSPRAHSFWMEHLDRGDICHIEFRGNLKKTMKLDCMCPRTSMFLHREALWWDFGRGRVIQSSHSQVTEYRGSRPTFYHKSKDRRKFCGRNDMFSLPGFMVCCPQIHEVLQFPNASFTPQLSVFLAQHKRLLDSRLHMLLWQPFPQALRSGGHSLMVA